MTAESLGRCYWWSTVLGWLGRPKKGSFRLFRTSEDMTETSKTTTPTPPSLDTGAHPAGIRGWCDFSSQEERRREEERERQRGVLRLGSVATDSEVRMWDSEVPR